MITGGRVVVAVGQVRKTKRSKTAQDLFLVGGLALAPKPQNKRLEVPFKEEAAAAPGLSTSQSLRYKYFAC